MKEEGEGMSRLDALYSSKSDELSNKMNAALKKVLQGMMEDL